MVTIVWAVVCHQAALDEHGWLSLHGIIDGLTAPELPIVVRDVMVVAKLDTRPTLTELAPRVRVCRPDGHGAIAETAYGMELFVAGNYLVARISGLPVAEAGLHRFEVSVMRQPPTTVAVAVFADQAAATREARVH